METAPVRYAWERFPEFIATNQYSRCLGRILVSLPRRERKVLKKPMIASAILIANGIAGAHAVYPPVDLTTEDREFFRSAGLTAIRASREALLSLREERLGSQSNLVAALELLERIETGLRDRPLPDSPTRSQN